MFHSFTAKGKVNGGKDSSTTYESKKIYNGDLESAVGTEAYNFIYLFADPKSEYTKILDTASDFNIKVLKGEVKNIINIKRINDVKLLNKFFETVNEKLFNNGVFVLRAETKEQRKKRILNKYPKFFSYQYYTLDFVLKRIFPKWGPTRRINFYLTRGNNRVLSMPEILGRLISCGFKIIYYKDINNLTYFVVQKETVPSYDPKPSYGLIFKMKRIGKDGKFIYVYKLRTMHPYSEYLQKFIYHTNHLKEGGKINNDYRITHWGKIFRKLWIDELPMLFNWLKGDLKLVGLRPLSAHYLSLYNKEFSERRIKCKPGLIPPYYVHLPKTLEEIMDSEKKYLDDYELNPIKTDVKYFFQAVYNIFFRGIRSS